MKSKLFFVVGLVTVFFISTPASAQQEEITLSTYYPAPFGEYDELCAEKLLVDTPSAAELQDMARGDCHITRSLIVGTAGGGFSYDALNAVGLPLYDGDVIIEGSVGIGTTGPAAPLHSYTNGYEVARFQGLDTWGCEVSLINGDGKDWRIGNQRAPGGFVIDEQGVATRLFIQNNTGNVGIGTTWPIGKLDVIRSTAGDIIIARNDATNYGATILQATNSEARVIASSGGTVGRPPLTFWTADAERVRITTAGNVGIGTTNPQAKLHVADGSTDIVKAYSSGIVDMPKQSMADVYRSSDYSVNPGWNKIDFNVENFDIQNEFDLTNDRFTATIAGKYLVTVNAFFTAMRDREGLVAAIYKNGARVAMNKTRCSSGIGFRDLGCAVSRIIDLSAGDYVEGWVENNSTLARTVGGTAPGYTGATFMSIAKIN